jgi:hypothetical protein
VRAVEIGVGDGDDVHMAKALQGLQVERRDVPGAEHGDPGAEGFCCFRHANVRDRSTARRLRLAATEVAP